MENSSDEDMNSDNEFVDLKPLWRDRPFLSDSTTDEEEVEDVFAPGIVLHTEPLDTSSSTDDTTTSSLDSFVAKMNDINTTMSAGRGISVGGFQSAAGSSQSIFTRVAQNRYSITYAEDQNNATQNETFSEHRFPQSFPYSLPERPPRPLRGLGSIRNSPRPIRGRNFASTPGPFLGNHILGPLEPDFSNLINLPLIPLVENNEIEENGKNEETLIKEKDAKFVLPAVLKEKEKTIEPNEVSRAERAMFVKELLMSTCEKRNLRSELKKSTAAFGSKNKQERK